MHNYQQEKKEETVNYISREYDNDKVIGVFRYIRDKKINVIISIERIQ